MAASVGTASALRHGPISREALPTPSLVVDLDAFEANVASLAALVAGAPGHTVRPHVKAHRTPALALMQLGPGTRGVTCATVGEAEAMVEAGIDDVLLANELVSRDKVGRLVALTRRARITATVDSDVGVAVLSDAARQAGTTVRVLVDVDLGMHRCGVAGPEEAIQLAGMVDAAPGLELVGLMGYEGRLRAQDPARQQRLGTAFATLAEARARLDAAGLAVGVVSASGTSTLTAALADPTVTEIQAGSYAVMEPDLDGLGLPFVPSVELVASVISAHRGRVVLDAGRKSVACDLGLPVPIDAPATTALTHEEHTILDWPGTLPALGTRVTLQPLNTRLTFNLHDWVWLARGGEVLDRVRVAASRGSA